MSIFKFKERAKELNLTYPAILSSLMKMGSQITTTSTISMWFTGKRGISADDFLRLCAILRLNVHHIGNKSFVLPEEVNSSLGSLSNNLDNSGGAV